MKMRIGCLIIALMMLPTACAVLPAYVREEALPQMPFQEMVAKAGQYKGKTVIVGGYVLSITNQSSGTELVALDVPLGAGQRPESRDLSQGRLIMTSDKFFDPEVYTKGRKLTIAGEILGSSDTDKGTETFPYLRIRISEIYLWPLEKPLPPDPYYGWDPWWWHPYPYYYREWRYRHRP
jgi:outer membrane lipoprotein